MARHIVKPDDDASRFRTVWLGPDQYTLPFAASYSAYLLWFVLSLVFTPLFFLAAGFAGLLWAQCMVILAVRFLMLAVDADLPLSALHTIVRAEARAFGRTEKTQTFTVSTDRLRVRSLGLPTTTPTREFTP